ncbi:MAG: DUF5103 domain-containing protein [Cyclobacteriaceae bacterium]|nr:DUF5103 domain-containing protein [Cyclobacteriaceae bacterium]
MLRLLPLFLLLVGTGYAQKKLELTDRTYEEQIRTVQLFPRLGTPRDYFQPAVANLRQQNLVLAFDDLQEDRQNYYVRLVHCNYDWTPSVLKDMDFLREFNEFVINDHQLSNNTNVVYYHYLFRVPPVLLPGNYVAVVYRDGEKNDLILTKRFMIFESRTAIGRDNQISGLGTLRAANQQLNFTVNYKNVEIINPLETVHVVIRQNQRWDNARFQVVPSFVREERQQLEYRFFDSDQNFNGGNEFRFVDFRSLNFPGQNTGSLNRRANPFELNVLVDKPRGGHVYAQYPDFNGNYVIDNRDFQDDPALAANYLFVNFMLATQPVQGTVYVAGAFNQWRFTPENQLTYDSNAGAYTGSVLLKQGWYDYQYVVQGGQTEPFVFEGSHFETENLYEILVYYRPFRPAADVLIGYHLLPVNSR